MTERVVLAYGDSNTHGTVPMATLEDQGASRPPSAGPGFAPQRSAPAGG